MEMTRFQKIMLTVTAGMLVLSGVLMITFHMHPGVLFEEGLLKITESEGQTIYSGWTHGESVTITVARDPGNAALTTVDFTIGARFHDTCEVEYPLPPIETENGYPVDGIRVSKNGSTLFEGAYDSEREWGWFDANGEWAPFTAAGIRVYAASDYWHGYETDAPDAVRFALGPSTSAHGDATLFFLGVFLSIILVVRIVFWKSFFRFEHRWARDPEPSEGYQVLEHIGWVIIAVVIGGIFVNALIQIR